jgi:hypothetical protein
MVDEHAGKEDGFSPPSGMRPRLDGRGMGGSRAGKMGTLTTLSHGAAASRYSWRSMVGRCNDEGMHLARKIIVTAAEAAERLDASTA